MQTWPLECLISVCKYVGSSVRWILWLSCVPTAAVLPTLLEILPQYVNHVCVNGGRGGRRRGGEIVWRREITLEKEKKNGIVSMCWKRETVDGHMCVCVSVCVCQPCALSGIISHWCFSWERFFLVSIIFLMFFFYKNWWAETVVWLSSSAEAVLTTQRIRPQSNIIT